MNRRNFLKSAICASGIALYGKAYAADSKQVDDDKVNRLRDKQNPSGLEKKHVPAIETPLSVKSGEWFDVRIRVGYLLEHPSTPEHWITNIKLRVNGNDISSTVFEKGGTSASGASFRIRLYETSSLEAVEHCNLHGTWASDPVEIKVL